MNVKILIEVIREEMLKVVTAFLTWGLGVLIMLSYSIFLIWLKNSFGLYVTILGSLLFLTIAFFFIDLWWNYSHFMRIKKMKNFANLK